LPRTESLGAETISRGNTLRSTARLRGSKSLTFLHHAGGQSRSSKAVPENSSVETQLALPSTLQDTARGWLKAYDSDLSQNFWCRQASNAAGPNGSVESERLVSSNVASIATRRDNYKKEHYSDKLDQIIQESDKQGVARPRLSTHGNRARAQSMQELEKEVKNVCVWDEIDHLLKGAASQHRHFNPKLEREKDGMSPEEETRLRHIKQKEELAARRAKKQTDQRGNPKWRVEEKIKHEREHMKFLKDSGEEQTLTQNLPMTQFAVQSDHGREEHTLVDIQKIQAKCKCLDASCSAKSLLTAQRIRDQEAVANAKKALEALEGPSKEELKALAEMPWEDSADRAQRRKLEGHISGVFNKMGQMRRVVKEAYPTKVPDSLKNHLHAMHAGDYSWHESCEH